MAATNDRDEDDVIERWLSDLVGNHYRTALKAPIITVMAAFAVIVFSGSYLKAIEIGAIVLPASLFMTWKRYLEPLCFFAFVIAAIVTCCDLRLLHWVQSAAFYSLRLL
jgi:hypothetical protein